MRRRGAKNPRGRRSSPPVLPAAALMAAMVLAALPGCAPADERAENLILVTVDTWRGDHVLTARAGTALTPNLAGLARESLVFSDASSVGNETSPGVAGFLTGLIPRRSGVLVNPNLLPEKVPTLATLLAEHGFDTLARVTNPVIAGGTGFEHGFDDYRLLRPGEGRAKAQASALTDEAFELLDARPDDADRLFLWLHYIDPHGPYHPPEAIRDELPLDGFGEYREVPKLLDGHSGFGGLPRYQQQGFDEVPLDVRDYIARYAAEVRFMDQEVGRLLTGLRDRHLLEDSLLVITSDHGEALEDDHGFWFSHGNGFTVDQVHVPLLVRCSACGSGVVDRPVSTVDVLPTVLDLLGVEAEVETDGIHLLDEHPRTLVSQDPNRIAIRRGPWKATWGRNGQATLVDLAADPGEISDLSGRHPEKLRELERLLREVRRRPVLAEPELRGNDQWEGMRKNLEALGYL